MDEILNELIAQMKKDFPRRPPTNENLYDYYMSRVKNNLHVALCFSPVSISHLANVMEKTMVVMHIPNHLIIKYLDILWIIGSIGNFTSLIGWWEIPQSILEIPWADFWMHHGLVPTLAKGRLDCCVQPFPGQLRHCLFTNSQNIRRRNHGSLPGNKCITLERAVKVHHASNYLSRSDRCHLCFTKSLNLINYILF